MISMIDCISDEKYEFESETQAIMNLFEWFCDEKHGNQKLQDRITQLEVELYRAEEKSKEEIDELERELSVKEELLIFKRVITDFELDENKTLKCRCPHCHKDFAAELPEDIEIIKKLKCDASVEDIKDFPKRQLKARSAEDWEEEYMRELEKQHQEDGIKINRLQNTIDTLVKRCAILMKKQEL